MFDTVYERGAMKNILTQNVLFKKHTKVGQHPTYTKTLRDE